MKESVAECSSILMCSPRRSALAQAHGWLGMSEPVDLLQPKGLKPPKEAMQADLPRRKIQQVPVLHVCPLKLSLRPPRVCTWCFQFKLLAQILAASLIYAARFCALFSVL